MEKKKFTKREIVLKHFPLAIVSAFLGRKAIKDGNYILGTGNTNKEEWSNTYNQWIKD